MSTQAQIPLPPGAQLVDPGDSSNLKLPPGATLVSAAPQTSQLPQSSGNPDLARWRAEGAGNTFLRIPTERLTDVRGALAATGEAAKGALKGLGSAIDKNPPPSPAFVSDPTGRFQQKTPPPANTEQKVGYYAEKTGEVALPFVLGGSSAVQGAGELLPSAERAGATLDSVLSKAKDVPVTLNKAADAATELMDWQRKTQLGPTINKFLNRITSPSQGPMNYEEARQWYQVLGKLSADETSKLPNVVQRSLKSMVSGLKQDIGDAAATVGEGEQYASGMGEYANAKKLEAMKQAAKDAILPNIVRGAAYGVGGSAAGGAIYGLWKLLSGN